MIKVLVIPNITNSRNIESDSFFDVMYQQISALGDKFFWIIPTTKENQRLKRFKNVLQKPINISGNVFHMRVNFPIELIKLLQISTLHKGKTNWKYYVEYDIVYSHLPDYSIRRFVPTPKKIIGYSHWWEMEICNGLSNMNNHLNFEREILGTLQMEVLFVNTQAQKNIVIEEAKKTFNDKIISKLSEIIQPLHLSVPTEAILNSPSTERTKTIVFNHRLTKYKGFPKFLRLMKKYRKQRTDFVVWISMAERYGKTFSEDWIETKSIPKEEYLVKLSNASVCVVPLETNYGWNISATDSMMVGTPTIFEECGNYREIFPNGLFYNSEDDFFDLMDKLLDDDSFVLKWGLKSIERAIELSENNNLSTLEKHLSDI